MHERYEDAGTTNSWGELALTAALAISSLTGCSTTDYHMAPPAAAGNTQAEDAVKAESEFGSLVLPARLQISEDFFALGTDLTAYASDTELGSFNQTNWISGTSYEFVDKSGAVIAKAQQRLFSWGVTIDIFDGNGAKIGTVKEEVLKSLLSLKSHYSILDAQDNLIASSEKLDFFSTKIDIKDSSGDAVATITRPMLNLGGDKWSIEFHNGEVDKRLLIFIPCFKSQADNQKE